MWITKDVELPEALIRAQRERRLVVFAGAGVSMGAPSNLPDFDTLASRIGSSVAERRAGEQVDDYLGRVEGLGAKVQELTRAHIGIAESKPCQIHRDIIDLFADAEAVRLITTNFDAHFSTVVKERYGDAVETYCAPALPLGRDFAGIAHLHGSVLKARPPLVLTDRDFGKAYLTEGWATRLLLDVFENFTVLFVGYSHSDPVMRYLARSLSGKAERFVLTVREEDEKWHSLGIAPVHFPRRSEENAFVALEEALHAWVSRARMGALDHERRISEIVAGSPVLEPEAADYMRAALGDEVTLRLFVRHAKHADWLNWANENGDFPELFKREGSDDPRMAIFAQWFATEYAVKEPGLALDLVGGSGGKVSPVLWHQLAWHLSICEPAPSVEIFTKWIAVLIICAEEHYADHQIGRLLLRCDSDEHLVAAKMIFRYCLRPRVRLERPWSSELMGAKSVRIRLAIGLHGDNHSLKSAWTTFFKPRFKSMRGFLKEVFVQTIASAYVLSMAETQGGFDPISFGRSAIEPHEQDRYDSDIDYAIDGLRDVLESTIVDDPVQSQRWITEWLGADESILRRLALHGLAESAAFSPEVSLQLISELELLSEPHLKHELFRVLEKKFAAAPDSTQRALVAQLAPAAVSSQEDELTSESSQYERFNLSAWLVKVAPESAAALEFFAREQAASPRFKVREYPDFDHWSSGARWVVEHSPRSVEELLEVEPSAQLDYLLRFKRTAEDYEGPTRGGLMSSIESAATRDFLWSIKLGGALANASEWRTSIWRALLGAWRQAELDAASLRDLAQSLRGWAELSADFARDLCDLVEQTASRVDSNESGLLADLEVIASRCLEVEEVADGVLPREGKRDWLTVAINHPGGRAILALLKLLPLRMGVMGEDAEMPEPYRSTFDRVLSGQTVTASRGRIVLASQTHYLFAVDAEWTRRRVIPLFNWADSELSAEQAWHGYMGWGRWNDAILSELLPFLPLTFARLPTTLSDIADSFASRFAGIALYSSIDPWHGGWLETLVRVGGQEACGLWAMHMSRTLGELESGAAETAWHVWLRDYWNARLLGVPRPLGDRERAEMLQWAFPLRPVFDEVLEKLTKEPAILGEHSMFFYELDDDPLLNENPVGVARLVSHILTSNSVPLYYCSHVRSVVGKLKANGVTREALITIIDSMVRIGCGQRDALLSMIETAD